MPHDVKKWATIVAVFAAVSAIAPLTLPPPAAAASFPCAKAASGVERAICADPALSARDAVMGSLYAAAARGDEANRLQAQQSQWLAGRAACATSGCLETSYDRRIGQLMRTKGARRLARDFFTRGSKGDVGQLSVFGPQEGLIAVTIASTSVGPGGAAAGDVNASGFDGVAELKSGRARIRDGSCALDLKALDASTWKVTQAGPCAAASGVTYAGVYRR